MNHFNCKKCDHYHKGGHCTAPNDKIREQRDELRRENNRLKRQLDKPDPIYSGLFSHRGYVPTIKDRYAEGFEEGKKLIIDEFAKQPPPVSQELIVAYRVWGYRDGLLRSSAYSNFSWPQRKALGKDLYHDKGIHAVKEYKQVIPLLQEYHPLDHEAPSVYNPTGIKKDPGIAGSVYLWGEVKEYEKGWMAECAYPKEFYLGEDADMLTVMQLEEDYGVPVILRKELNKEELKKKDESYMLWHGHSYYTVLNSAVMNWGYSTPVTVTHSPNWHSAQSVRTNAQSVVDNQCTVWYDDLAQQEAPITTALAKVYPPIFPK